MALYRVLVATDFTSSADRALARALRLPLDDGAELHLLHVVPARLPWQIGAAVRSGAWERLRTLAERAERRLAARQRHDVTVRPVLATGRPAEVIARRAAAGKAELVVVGRHGQRGFPEALLGSTAVEVLRAVPAPCWW